MGSISWHHVTKVARLLVAFPIILFHAMGNNYKPKMGTEYLKKLFERPEKLDQDDLLGISLSILSKNLGITGKV